MTKIELTQIRRSEKVSAWTVHLFTASGAFWGLLAILAVWEHRWQDAFFWMVVSTVVDGFDGSLARRFEVKGRLPGFDGALLDNIIDYLTYVVIPALILYVADLLPAQFAMVGAATVLLSSAFQFCQEDAKTEDNYFKGFPSYWNAAVFYLFILNLSPWFNLAVIFICGMLVFVPIKYIYPSRTIPFQKLTMFLSGLWGVVALVLLIQYPVMMPWLLWGSLYYPIYYFGLSFYLNFRP